MSLTGPAVRAVTAGPQLAYGRPVRAVTAGPQLPYGRPGHGAGWPYGAQRYGQLAGRGQAPMPVRKKDFDLRGPPDKLRRRGQPGPRRRFPAILSKTQT